ncbi:MAG: phenylalanine--tRNA ligase subunit alpha [Candidatus Omnitrophota bacterium]
MDINSIKNQIDLDLENINSSKELEELRIKYLGRKGLIAELFDQMRSAKEEERPALGKALNSLKIEVSQKLDEKSKNLSQSTPSQAESIDITCDGILPKLGKQHILNQTIQEICGIFKTIGFEVVNGPEIETEFNNFTGLNIALEHPSRDTFDTFYLGKSPSQRGQKLLLRSHTSPVQIRVMKSRKPPLAVVVPGKVYRPDATDASHSFMFHQVEGFMVDETIRFSDLKGTLELFAKSVFGEDIKMRFRPHYFPFTEPSAEVDISCIICKGEGCSVCGRKGWLEVLGAGMIHPNVFKNVGYPAGRYTGFAFGMGIERIAMLKYGIEDIRLFFENDLRFLSQF